MYEERRDKVAACLIEVYEIIGDNRIALINIVCGFILSLCFIGVVDTLLSTEEEVWIQVSYLPLYFLLITFLSAISLNMQNLEYIWYETIDETESNMKLVQKRSFLVMTLLVSIVSVVGSWGLEEEVMEAGKFPSVLNSTAFETSFKCWEKKK
eukprot:snap_masked-scaffold_1-processed-gene-22.20-mRNA-1 protein AED:1.00 eAED:1.00 QI:0/0/0/0/1/1/2/0/152